MEFRPLQDRIVVRRIEAYKATGGGIIVPETAREKAERGEVVAVGSGALDERGRLVSIDVRVGDVVLFGKSSGTEMRLNDEELVIMKEGDVLGILAEAPSHKKAA